MLNGFSRARLTSCWFGGVVAAFACTVAAGGPMTLNAAELWLVASMVPAAVMLFVWRGAPPVTVAEVLYAINTPPQAGR